MEPQTYSCLSAQTLGRGQEERGRKKQGGAPGAARRGTKRRPPSSARPAQRVHLPGPAPAALRLSEQLARVSQPIRPGRL